MPLVRASQAMQRAGVGDIVKVLATDRGSVPDFQAWVKNRPQFALLKQEQEASGGKTVYIHFLKRVS
jgi:TusA-related sulfurtransferase